jgi:hypothetical protein
MMHECSFNKEYTDGEATVNRAVLGNARMT